MLARTPITMLAAAILSGVLFADSPIRIDRLRRLANRSLAQWGVVIVAATLGVALQCRAVIARTPGAHTFTRAGPVLALTAAGASDDHTSFGHEP
jgi:hypothetical protein